MTFPLRIHVTHVVQGTQLRRG